jgi:hypothetical protein
VSADELLLLFLNPANAPLLLNPADDLLLLISEHFQWTTASSCTYCCAAATLVLLTLDFP